MFITFGGSNDLSEEHLHSLSVSIAFCFYLNKTYLCYYRFSCRS